MTHNFLKEVAKVFIDSEGNIAYNVSSETQELMRLAIERRERGFRIGIAQLVQDFLETHDSYSDEELLEVITGDAEHPKLIAWCVSCRENVPFKATIQTSDSGRRMAKGQCPACKGKLNRILGRA